MKKQKKTKLDKITYTITGEYLIPDIDLASAIIDLKEKTEALRELASAETKYVIDTHDWYEAEKKLEI